MNEVQGLDEPDSDPDSGRGGAPALRHGQGWIAKMAAGALIGLGVVLLAWLLWPHDRATTPGGRRTGPPGDRYTFADLLPEPPTKALPGKSTPTVHSIAPATLEAGSLPIDITMRGVDLGGALAVQAIGSDILFGTPEVAADGQRITVRASAPRNAAVGEYPVVVRLASGDAAPSTPAGDRVRIVAPVAPPAAPPTGPPWVPPPPQRAPIPEAKAPVEPIGPNGEPKIDPVLARRLSSPIGSGPAESEGHAPGPREEGRGAGIDLTGTKIGLTRARRLANLALTIPAGTQIPCVLDTAIQTDQAGFVSCSLSGDIYGADGTVILLDRGSQVLGEYRPTSISW